MDHRAPSGWLRTSRLSGLRDALGELLAREFSWSNGYTAVLFNSCMFAPSILSFWFVNGILDFSTAFVIGSVGANGVGLAVRLLAYLLLVPVFLGLRMAHYLLHPRHRQAVFEGTCPNHEFLSLDWFSVGIVATGLPLAWQRLGPWVGSNAIFLVGIFVLPQFVTDRRRALQLKIGSLLAGTLVFLYASYGAALAVLVPSVPQPALVLGPVATLALTEQTTATLLRGFNSLLLGPIVVALLAVVMNWLLTHPALTEIPLLSRTLPSRDPNRIVLTSAALGTAFYLGFVFLATGRLVVVP